MKKNDNWKKQLLKLWTKQTKNETEQDERPTLADKENLKDQEWRDDWYVSKSAPLWWLSPIEGEDAPQHETRS